MSTLEYRQAVLESIRRSQPVTARELAIRYPNADRLSSAIRYLRNNGYLGWQWRGDELEYTVVRKDGLPVKRPKAGVAYGYGWKLTDLDQV